jgi:hypothetical protein
VEVVDELGAETAFLCFFLDDALLVEFVFQVFQQFGRVDLAFGHSFSIIKMMLGVNRVED